MRRVIFVDANVFIHHMGRPHPLRDRATKYLFGAAERGEYLVTSAEVMQEVVHYYRRSRRDSELPTAMALLAGVIDDVWPVEREDVELAVQLAEPHPALATRDLVHLACCMRRQPRRIMTFDRGLAAAWEARR